ncbi:hypothetical protein [Bacillus cereus]|nr:hypothetical protein [Bacillus cereus]
MKHFCKPMVLAITLLLLASCQQKTMEKKKSLLMKPKSIIG